MRLSALERLRSMARTIRGNLRQRIRPAIPRQFQPYSHTLPDRYPWLFKAVQGALSDAADVRLLSFGCSRGDEVFSLRKYFPTAAIRGIDANPNNIAICTSRVKAAALEGASFKVGSSTESEPAASYDAIFCLAVLCHGELTNMRARRCDPLIRFADFESQVAGFSRCLKPGGLLLLHTTNFRFCDTEIYTRFVPWLAATDEQLAPDLIFDRDNNLMPGVRYHAVGFRKVGF